MDKMENRLKFFFCLKKRDFFDEVMEKVVFLLIFMEDKRCEEIIKD